MRASRTGTGKVVALLGLRGAGKSTLGAARSRGASACRSSSSTRWWPARPACRWRPSSRCTARRGSAGSSTRCCGASSNAAAAVLATGGSIVTAPETYEMLRERATTVWLKARPQDHWDRVVSPGRRAAHAQPRQRDGELRALLRTRKPLYSLADHVVDTSSATFDEAARRSWPPASSQQTKRRKVSMIELASYVCGRVDERARAAAATLVNPATEEPLAHGVTEGVDFGAALAFARERGGPALRAMTFAQRGELLAGDVARRSTPTATSCMALAITNGGNTRSDAKFDIDGASGTLAAYADLGAGARRRARPRRRRGHPARPQRRASSASTCTCRARASPCTSTPSTSPRGAWARRPRARCSRACRSSAKPATSTALRRAPHRARSSSRTKVLPEGALSLRVRARREICSTGSAGRTCSPSPDRAAPRPRSSARTRRHVARSAARQRRGRQPQRRRPRPRRGRRLGGGEPLRRRRRARHDAEDRAEVHRHPPRLRAGRSVDCVLERLKRAPRRREGRAIRRART